MAFYQQNRDRYPKASVSIYYEQSILYIANYSTPIFFLIFSLCFLYFFLLSSFVLLFSPFLPFALRL